MSECKRTIELELEQTASGADKETSVRKLIGVETEKSMESVAESKTGLETRSVQTAKHSSLTCSYIE